MGEKLNLRQASYEGLQNVKRVEKITSPEYDRLAVSEQKNTEKSVKTGKSICGSRNVFLQEIALHAVEYCMEGCFLHK